MVKLQKIINEVLNSRIIQNEMVLLDDNMVLNGTIALCKKKTTTYFCLYYISVYTL